VLLAGNTSPSEDNVKVVGVVSWGTEENVVIVAVLKLLVLGTVLALDSINDVVWPWVGSVLSGVNCASRVTLTGPEIALDTEIACSVVEASLTSLIELTVLGTSASDVDVGDGLLSSTIVWLEELVKPVANANSCTVLLLIMVVGSVLSVPLVASTFWELESLLGSWTGASLGWVSLGTVPLDWVLLLGSDRLKNWSMLLVCVAIGDAGLALRGKVLVSSGRADVGSPWERETLVTCMVGGSRSVVGRSDELERLSLSRGVSELEVASDMPEVATGSSWAVRVSADSTSVDDSRGLTGDVPVGSGIVASILAIELLIDRLSCADLVSTEPDASAISDSRTAAALEIDERLTTVFDWGLEKACVVWPIDTKVSAVVLAIVRYSPLEVEPGKMVELCASTTVDDDARLVVVSVKSASLDEESTDTGDVRAVLAAASGSEMIFAVDVWPCVLAGLVTSIELLLERRVSAKELDEERSMACVDTLEAGMGWEGSTTTTVLTAELTICEVTEESEDGLLDSDRTGIAEVLAVELKGPEEPSVPDVLAGKLVDCDESDVSEPSEIWLVLIVVIALVLDAGFWLEPAELGDCTLVAPAPITRVGDTWMGFSDWGADEVWVVVGDLLDEPRETGSWPRIAEVSMDDEKFGDVEALSWDKTVLKLIVSGTVPVAVAVEDVDWEREDVEATLVVWDKSKDTDGIDKSLGFDGSCPRVGLWLEGVVVAPPAIEDDGLDDRVVADWVWLEIELSISVDEEASLAMGDADPCAAEAPVTDDNIPVELSGGQDNMPRHLRDAVIFTGIGKELDETTETDKIVERLRVDELCRAEPRTTLEDLIVE
jgi:hypothetical protein